MIELKIIRHHRGRLLGVLCAVVALVGIIKWTTGAAYAADTLRAGEKIITIHDAGEQKGIVTTAKTLREALAQADIRVDANDITEPALDEPLVASSYEANIYRARTVAVKDGGKTTPVITAYRTGKQIAKQAGITLNEADTATLQPSRDLIADGAAEVLTIDRATPVTLTFYGKTIQTSTRAVTVGEMLTQKRITPSGDDTLMPAADTIITAGMTVQLWRNGKQVITADEEITFATRTVNDANRDVGYKEVQTPGVNGKKTVTYEIIMKDGVEVSRQAVNSVTVTEPTEQVETIGTKVNLPVGSHTDWMAAAGIAEADYGYVDYIVGRESGWSATKYNYAGSGAYGLCQSLPASKMATAGSDYMTNPITQLKWCNSYAVGRYGSWAGAYNFWLAKHWW